VRQHTWLGISKC